MLWRHSGDRWRCQLCVSPMFLGAVTFLFLVSRDRQPMPQSMMTEIGGRRTRRMMNAIPELAQFSAQVSWRG